MKFVIEIVLLFTCHSVCPNIAVTFTNAGHSLTHINNKEGILWSYNGRISARAVSAKVRDAAEVQGLWKNGLVSPTRWMLLLFPQSLRAAAFFALCLVCRLRSVLLFSIGLPISVSCRMGLMRPAYCSKNLCQLDECACKLSSTHQLIWV